MIRSKNKYINDKIISLFLPGGMFFALTIFINKFNSITIYTIFNNIELLVSFIFYSIGVFLISSWFFFR